MIDIFSVQPPSKFIIYTNISQFRYDQQHLQNLNQLKIDLKSNEVVDFDKFQNFINEVDHISELSIDIDISQQHEVYEVFNYLFNTILPKYKNNLKKITFNRFNIQEKDKRSTNLAKSYLVQIVEILINLEVVSFELKNLDKEGKSLHVLFDFLSIFSKESEKVIFKMLNIKIVFDKTIRKLQDLLKQMPKCLSYLKNLEGLSFDLNNLGLDQQYFQDLFQTISKMNRLNKLFMNIGNNRLTINNSIKCIQQLGSISNNIQSLIYLDYQVVGAQCIQAFTQGMKKFNNLKELYLQGLQLGQNLGEQFFSIFSFYSQLEKLNLDLYYSDKLFEEDFGQFVKNMKSLTNLHSLFLTLPYFKPQQQQKSNFCQGLVRLIQNFENQLQSLQLELNQQYDLNDSNQIAEAVCQLKNLKYLQIKLGISYIQSQQIDEETIWNQKLPQIVYYSSNVSTIELIKVLYNKIMLKQNSEMESLTIEYSDKYEFKEGDYEKFTQIKYLCVKLNLIKIMQEIKFHSTNYLKTLTFPNRILEWSKITEICQNCKCLSFLSMNVERIEPQFLESLLKDQPFLQKLFINENAYFFQSFDYDLLIIQNSNYLTELKVGRQQTIYHKVPRERYVNILQIIIYQKLIQPQIIYKPQQSHFDLVLN